MCLCCCVAVIILSYETFRRNVEKFQVQMITGTQNFWAWDLKLTTNANTGIVCCQGEGCCDLLICDEAHRLKVVKLTITEPFHPPNWLFNTDSHARAHQPTSTQEPPIGDVHGSGLAQVHAASASYWYPDAKRPRRIFRDGPHAFLLACCYLGERNIFLCFGLASKFR